MKVSNELLILCGYPMSEQPLVSVLMNCYNGEKYLREAIESVLAQSYHNWELIFWDNQSVDHSATIFKSYKDARLKYFLAPKHTDLGAARIFAQECLHGIYVAVLDADDMAHPDRLLKQVEFLERNEHVALVASWVKLIDSEGNFLSKLTPPADSAALNDLIGWKNPITHSAVMYRLQAAKEVGGYSKHFSYAQDYCLLIDLAEMHAIAVLDQFLCTYRMLPSGLSRSRKLQRLIAHEQIVLFGLAREKLKLSPSSIKHNIRSTANSQIRLGLADIYHGYFLRGLLSILGSLQKHSAALWGNVPFR